MRPLKAAGRFVNSYKLFSFALLAVIAAAAATILKQTIVADWVLGSAAAVSLIPVIIRIVRDLREGRYGVDILAALAIGTSVVLQQYWAAIVIVIMLSGGESLEHFAAARARSELRALLKRAPQQAHVLRKGKVVDVPARQVQEGDKFVVRPGEIIPADGIIDEGATAVDESSLTGESLPQSRDTGSQVLSGSVNIDGVITVTATHSAADSQYQQIVRLVTAAAEHQAPFARLADRYSVPFTVVALTIAGCAWILSHQPIRFLEVIVVATPCPLILATPIALIAGMSRASRDGIIIKTGTALEQLAQAKVFAFDKTGTLTHGKPEVAAVTVFYPFRKQEVLSLAAAVEQNSNHVLAAAIRKAAAVQSLKLPKIKHMHEIAGRGLEARVKNSDVIIGRFSLMEQHAVTMPKQFDPRTVSEMATFIADGGTLAGYITFRDALRSETKSILAQIKSFGIRKILMITGDRNATATSIAKVLGITHFIADALPGDKVREIEAISERPVVFVGDGVNDAPVLMAADVGVALGARGSTAASESADVVIMKDDLRLVARAVAIAKRSFRIATQSIVIGIGLSVALMFVFATGKFSPIIGAVTQEVVDVLVILNALRAHNPAKLPKLH